MRRDLGVGPRGTTHSELVPWAQANQQLRNGSGVFAACGAVYTRGINVFVPRLLELSMYGIFLNRGWDLILSGCGGTSTLAQQEAFPAFWIYEPRPISNQQSVHMGGISTPCGAVPSRGITVVVPGLLEM